MNCVANILHKICNASVFFSAYRTCYNSIVKIEQKRKSAFFRGRSFCLEVVEISREERDVYLIPQNFVDTGTILGVTVKLRCPRQERHRKEEKPWTQANHTYLR